jgi:hypothetical protein
MGAGRTCRQKNCSIRRPGSLACHDIQSEHPDTQFRLSRRSLQKLKPEL